MVGFALSLPGFPGGSRRDFLCGRAGTSGRVPLGRRAAPPGSRSSRAVAASWSVALGAAAWSFEGPAALLGRAVAEEDVVDMGSLLEAFGGQGEGEEEVNRTRPEYPPVTSSEVGRAAWMLFHTVAAEYPERPSRKEKEAAKRFFAALPHVYPCKECAAHFADVLRHAPPQVGSKRELVAWVCHVHNVVNRRLGKPTFPCDPADLHARWGTLHCDSGGGCARPRASAGHA